MTDQSADTALEFPINQALLEEATKRREEWMIVRDRLTKIEQSKSQVTPVVYERVRKDYEARLAKATEELMIKKEAVDHELATLRDTRKRIGAQFTEHKNKLDEIKFRNTLGEFSEEEYQSETKVEQDKLAKFETILSAVDSNIARYESIFANDTELIEVEKAPAKKTPAAARKPEAEPATDLHKLAPEGEELEEDYFQAVDDAAGTEPNIEESATMKETSGSARGSEPHARIVVTSGPNAGTAYPIKGVISFGRAESNTVVLKDSKVSRQHSQIQQQGSEFMIVDLNSSNGTFVNRQRIEEHVLSNGDEIQIGDSVMQFQD